MRKVPYIIGDVHGCLDELLELEAQIAAHAAQAGVQPFYVCVGDLVDRGPKSAQVVEHFRRGAEEETHQVVLGNHECELLRQIFHYKPKHFEKAGAPFPRYLFSLEDDFALNQRASVLASNFDEYLENMQLIWLSQGGRETLQSYGCDPKKPATWDLGAEHLRFLTRLPIVLEGEQLFVSHALMAVKDWNQLRKAGLVWPLQGAMDARRQEELALGTYKNVTKEAVFALLWNRTLPAKRLYAQKLQVSGHTPLEKVRWVKALGVVQIDTGCVYGRKLTAFCPELNTFLHQDSQTEWNHSD